MNKILIKNILVTSIAVISLLLLALPYGRYYLETDHDPGWRPMYVLDHWFLASVHLLFMLLLMLRILFRSYRSSKLLTVLVIISGVYLGFITMIGNIGSTDYAVAYGLFLAPILLLLTAIWLWMDRN